MIIVQEHPAENAMQWFPPSNEPTHFSRASQVGFPTLE